MDYQQEGIYGSRKSPQGHYDKRLIEKVVQEVENGLPRKEAVRIYGLGKNSLCSWMRQYGSEHYRQNLKRKSYTNLQKRTIVTAIEQGRMTVGEAQAAYAIRDRKTIRAWILRHKKEKVELYIENSPSMAREKASPEDPEKAALQNALKQAELKIKALNTLIDVAEDQLKIDIRKKSGAKQ